MHPSGYLVLLDISYPNGYDTNNEDVPSHS